MDPVATNWLIRALFILPLAAACFTDLTRFRIPNMLCAAMGLGFPLAQWLSPMPAPWLLHVMTALAVLGAGLMIFIAGLMGGGDAKLMSICGLWMGPSLTMAALVLTAVAGGVLCLVLLALRALSPHAKWGILRKDAPIPYGLAIATAGILLSSRLPMLAA